MSDRRTRDLVLDAENPARGAVGRTHTAREILPWIFIILLCVLVGYLVVNPVPRDAGTVPISMPTPPGGGRQEPAGPRLPAFADVATTNLVVRGIVEPIAPMPAIVPARADGVVAAVFVQPGDVVIPGQTLLAELQNHQLTLSLARHKAAVDAAKARVDARAPKARQAESQAASANLQRAKEDRDRLVRAVLAAREVSPDAVAPQAFAALEADLQIAEAALVSAQQAVDSLQARLQAESAEARAEWAAAEAAKALVEFQLQNLRVVAPATATAGENPLRVLRVLVAPGQFVRGDFQTGTPLLEVYDPNQLQVRAEVPARELRDGTRISLPPMATSPRQFPAPSRRPSPSPTPEPPPTPGTPGTPTPRDSVTTGGNSSASSSPTVAANESAAPGALRLRVEPFESRSGSSCVIRLSADKNTYAGEVTGVLPIANAEEDSIVVFIRFSRPNERVRPGTPVTVEFEEK